MYCCHRVSTQLWLNIYIYIISYIIYTEVRWAGHAACFDMIRKCLQFWSENPKERDTFGGIAYVVRAWTWCRARQRAVVNAVMGFTKHGTTHRPGDDSCQQCDRCACTRFLGQSRIANVRPDGIRALDSLTTRYPKCIMFSVRVR
jgi:hypothetical protein